MQSASTTIQEPGNPAALLQEAIAHHQAGRLPEAEALYRAILHQAPHHPDAHHNLGQLARQVGKPQAALPHLKAALEANPAHGQYWLSFIAALIDCGELQAAAQVLAQGRSLGLSGPAVEELARRVEAGVADHLVTLAERYSALGQLENALQVLQEAVERDPTHFVAWNNYGSALRTLGRTKEAQTAFEKAHALNPSHPVPLVNLGLTAIDLYDLDAALQYCDRALALAPEDPDLLARKAVALSNVDRCDEAVALLEQALAKQDSLQGHFRYWLMLPWLPQSREELMRWRARFAQGIEELLRLPHTTDNPTEAFGDWFRLAYHGEDDKPLMENVCRLLRAKVPQINFTTPHIASWQFPIDRKIRFGICSHGLRNHPVGKFTSGFLRELDRARFELHVIHTIDSKPDPVRDKINGWADRVVALSGSHTQQLEQIAALELDALFLPNVTEEKHLYLGCARLAPVQFTSWGIASTSGIDTIDYYLSSALIEPPEAVAHYSEHLILLPHLPAYMAFVVAPQELLPRAHWGLAIDRPLYFCPQSLFKYHPDFDAVLAAIAALDPRAQIVAIEGMASNWTQRLRERWAKSAPILLERVTFLPRQEHNAYMALVAQSDLLLDPVHFGSGTTFYEAMYYGTPIVTWPGRFMRGRIVAGGYRQMGLSDVPVAERLEDYAQVAVAWANDPARRQAFRQQALAAREKLFADTQAVRDLETFLIAALEAAARGERLPSGWRVPMGR